MDVKDFYYDLPEELIAQVPLADRTASRLMSIERATGEFEHLHFRDIISKLNPGDCLVLNDTRVLPARLYGVKKITGAAIEFVLLNRVKNDSNDNLWEVILRPGRRAHTGACFVFGDGLLEAEVVDVKENGNRIVKFTCDGIFEEVLDKIGLMPLPPYIKEKLEDKERYQTVYSRENGSAAAPTAGLHFTKELLKELNDKGVKTAFVTLHVGLGTFRPVKVEKVEEHYMHEESYSISEETCRMINETKQNGGRVVAVGTTSCRVLESVADESGHIEPANGSTRIFIYPGYKFKILDGLITNFHLPESTLIMLVSAFAGKDNVMNAYCAAIEEKYRFFSFGDAMIIL
ncbi:MAG: tRNA preQ1(34) S-adenosylmethionine ribosyltransferase-isomerase QueA [Clostridia bacterium]|nr:tRNA preQ1(34) S-adenosylmethionine ribosyltransferase-isomerase QueA [Clostridia bacterium]